MNTWRCGYPPCRVSAQGTKKDLRDLGWILRAPEILCPVHAKTVQSLF
jgi:hypothetical protein